ncbi:MAG: helix-turn-helix domain-containing protein [Planctomycetota bacterium]
MLEPERRILKAALDANDWNRSETARQLGIDRGLRGRRWTTQSVGKIAETDLRGCGGQYRVPTRSA